MTKSIQLGTGRHLVTREWSDKGEATLNIRDMGAPHEVGEAPATAVTQDMPEPLVALKFPHKQSAEAIRDVLNQIIQEWENNG